MDQTLVDLYFNKRFKAYCAKLTTEYEDLITYTVFHLIDNPDDLKEAVEGDRLLYAAMHIAKNEHRNILRRQRKNIDVTTAYNIADKSQEEPEPVYDVENIVTEINAELNALSQNKKDFFLLATNHSIIYAAEQTNIDSYWKAKETFKTIKGQIIKSIKK